VSQFKVCYNIQKMGKRANDQIVEYLKARLRGECESLLYPIAHRTFLPSHDLYLMKWVLKIYGLWIE